MEKEIIEFINVLTKEARSSYEEMLHIVSVKFDVPINEVERIYKKDRDMQ